MSQDSPPPLIIAHRGGSAFVPENTLAAFQYAVDHGADGVELDVHLTADGEAVVIHDADLGRTTDGIGRVDQKPLTEIKELDAGGWFGPQFSGQRIPTLAEVFDLVGSRLLVNVELKGPGFFKSQLPARAVEIVRQFGLADQVIFSSFNPWLLQQTRRLMPEARLGLLLLPGWPGGLGRVISKPVVTPWAYHPHFSSIDPAFLARAARESRPVLAYTVNQSQEIRRLCELGIYGIITDDPVKAALVKAELEQ